MVNPYVQVWEPGVIVKNQVKTVIISPFFIIDYISNYLNYPQDIYTWINTQKMHIQSKHFQEKLHFSFKEHQKICPDFLLVFVKMQFTPLLNLAW